MQDKTVFKLIDEEIQRQADGLEMIPSENHTSGEVLKALGSRRVRDTMVAVRLLIK